MDGSKRGGYILDIKTLVNNYLPNVIPISTGIPQLDDVLEGGFKPYSKYMLYGEAGTWKTRISLRLVENAPRDSSPVIISCKHGALPTINGEKRFLHMDRVEEINTYLERLLALPPNKPRIIIIDDLDHAGYSNISEIYDMLTLLNKIIYRDQGLLIVTSGVSQQPGNTKTLKPRLPRIVQVSMDVHIFLSREADNRIRIYNMSIGKSAIINI